MCMFFSFARFGAASLPLCFAVLQPYQAVSTHILFDHNYTVYTLTDNGKVTNKPY